jgi:hypothetical protein
MNMAGKYGFGNPWRKDVFMLLTKFENLLCGGLNLCVGESWNVKGEAD